MEIGIIILAAGSSSRMGQSKQLLQVDQQPLLLRAVSQALSISKSTVVVLGSDAQLHHEIINKTTSISVVNKDWEKGIGSSIKAGLAHLLKIKPEINAALFMVCDQPHVTALYLQQIIGAYIKLSKPIIASWYQYTPGVPVLFSRTEFSKLLNLPDNEGAKKIIMQASQDKKHFIEFPEGAIDIDTPDDYLNYIGRRDK